MMSLRTLVEVKVILAVEKPEPLRLIVHAVGMDDVHHNGYSHPVSGVHQFLELLRSAETRAQGEEIGNLVAE